MPDIVAIAGPPGSGKSSLVKALSKSFDNASIVYFDHYQEFVKQSQIDIIAWMDAGADYNEFQLPQLAADLAVLKSGRPVKDPANQAVLEPTETILFETLFGRAHRATGQYIDRLIWLDTPLDIALARNIKACNQPPPDSGETQDKTEQSLILLRQQQWIEGYLQHYLAFVGRSLQIQQQQVKPAADCVVDGCERHEDVMRKVRHFLNPEQG